MSNSENTIIDYDFLGKVMDEYKKLDPDGKIYVRIGNKKEFKRAISNTNIEVTVTSEEEKKELAKMYQLEKTRKQKPIYHQKRIGNLVQEINNENRSTREGIELAKNNKIKRNVKKQENKGKNKRWGLSEETKEKIKEFLKEKGIDIGVGITALAIMGTIAAVSLNDRAENIQRYNNEFTGIEQVEEKIKGIIDSEIVEAIENSELENEDLTVDIDRIEPDRDLPGGIKIEVRGIKVNYEKRMVFTERKELFLGDIPESLEEMAESYLDIQELPSRDIKDRHKNKAIKLLEKVERIAAKKDLKLRKTIASKLFGGNDYTMKETFERKSSNDEIEK